MTCKRSQRLLPHFKNLLKLFFDISWIFFNKLNIFKIQPKYRNEKIYRKSWKQRKEKEKKRKNVTIKKIQYYEIKIKWDKYLIMQTLLLKFITNNYSFKK